MQEETGAPHKTGGIMRREHYVEILKKHLKTSFKKLKFGFTWVFQMVNNTKHASKVVT